MRKLLPMAVLALSWPLAAGAAQAQQTQAPRPAASVPVEAQVIAKGLSHPWGMQILPEGQFLVTERPGRMRIVSRDGRLSPPLAGLPTVYASGQGGLLDVALSPDFATTQRIYISFAEPRGSGGSNGTSLARARLVREGDGGRLEGVEVIFRQEPSYASSAHFGSRIVIMRDGSLTLTLGDRFVLRNEAQNAGNHIGKVVRLTPDGAPFADNPKREGWRPEVWSIGHRNVQGAALNPATGKVWTIEHGARGGDEINVPEAGRNYGWPVITYGRDYSGAKIGEGTTKAGLEQPVYYWDPSIAPSGATFYTGSLVPQWAGNLFVGALAGQALHRLVLDGNTVVGEEVLLKDLGQRIRDVRQGPDGALYVLTDESNGQLLRVAPRGR
jgi:glucose/arabinose dehydrogenase